MGIDLKASADLKTDIDLFVEQALASEAHVYKLSDPTELQPLIDRLADGAPVVFNPEKDFASTANSNQNSSLPSPAERTLGVVTAAAGIAETGSVVLVERTRAAKLHSLLSQELLVLIRAEAIRPTLASTQDLITEAAIQSAQVTFLTGPSRTGDIELRQVSGIQGPYAVYLALCDFDDFQTLRDLRDQDLQGAGTNPK